MPFKKTLSSLPFLLLLLLSSSALSVVSPNFEGSVPLPLQRGQQGQGQAVDTEGQLTRNSRNTGASVPSENSNSVSPQSMYYYEMYPSQDGKYHQQVPSYSSQNPTVSPFHYSGGGTHNRQGFDGGFDGGLDGGLDAFGDGADLAGDGAGLFGLLGLLGLKGLKPYITNILAFLLAPILLPILAPIFIIGTLILLSPLLLLLFIKVPVIVLPDMNITTRAFPSSARSPLRFARLPELAKEVLESEECVERISCEISRVSRNWKLDGVLSSLTGKLPSDGKFTKKILTGVNFRDARKTFPKLDQDCGAFKCKAKSILVKHFAQDGH